jgi:ubiquinone biosynthesis protein COQ9
MTDKQTRRDNVILAALKHVPFDGWTPSMLGRAAEDAGFLASDADLLFPDGVPDAVAHFLDLADRLMIEDYAKQDTSKLKHREKIALIVRLRLERWTPHRESVRRALSLSPMPSIAGNTLKSAYITIDAMWKAIGDKSIDFSFYTKRMLLAGVYGSTLLYWLEDRSEHCKATWDFLSRRIDNVMQIPKIKGQLAERLAQFPTPSRLVQRFKAIRTQRGSF